MANDKFGVKEVMNVTLYDMGTKRPVIYFDTLKTSSVAFTNEKVYARGGRGNTKLITWEVNKEGTLTIEDALLSPKSMELISGIARDLGAQTISMRQSTEYDITDPDNPIDRTDMYPLTGSATGEITLAYTPIEGVSDILIYEYADDCGVPMPMAGATLAGNKITVLAAADKRVVAYYTFKSKSTSESYVIDATHFSGTYRLVGDTLIRNLITGKDEAFQIEIPNLKWSSDLTLDFKAEGVTNINQLSECA